MGHRRLRVGLMHLRGLIWTTMGRSNSATVRIRPHTSMIHLRRTPRPCRKCSIPAAPSKHLFLGEGRRTLRLWREIDVHPEEPMLHRPINVSEYWCEYIHPHIQPWTDPRFPGGPFLLKSYANPMRNYFHRASCVGGALCGRGSVASFPSLG